MTRVWAPDAQSVDLVLADAQRPMSRAAGGWWDGPDLPDGTDYGFSLDGSDPLPDPRSFYQPYGVDGLSRSWDPSRHHWVASPGTSVLGNVIYELHVGTFTAEGTLISAIERLDHLRDLGVTTVELMPLAQFSGEFGWGYDGVDLFAVHRAYGGPDALVEFVNAAHERGLNVCIDVVLNHLGVWGNYLSMFAPYFHPTATGPWGPVLDLNGPEQRAYLIDVCRHWLVTMHADALRLDAVHAIHDETDRHLLAELSQCVAQWSHDEGRPMTLIAESDLNQPSMVMPTSEGGMGMDAQWADDIHHALHVALTGEIDGYYGDFADTHALATVLENVFYHDGRYSTFRHQNWGAPVPATLDRRKFVVFSQDHDQVGNRAQGDRPSQVLSDAQLVASEAIILLSPFTPMLFMGEEWGTRTPFRFFADQEDDERAQLVREGRQKEFSEHGWSGDVPDPTSRTTVDHCVLDWSEPRDGRCRRMLEWARSMIHVRATAPGVRDGVCQRVTHEGDIVRMINGAVAVEADMNGDALPAADSHDWPRENGGHIGSLLASFPDQKGAAVRVWQWVGVPD